MRTRKKEFVMEPSGKLGLVTKLAEQLLSKCLLLVNDHVYLRILF